LAEALSAPQKRHDLLDYLGIAHRDPHNIPGCPHPQTPELLSKVAQPASDGFLFDPHILADGRNFSDQSPHPGVKLQNQIQVEPDGLSHPLIASAIVSDEPASQD